MPDNARILSREVSAHLVPSGDTFQLPEGLSVTITHRLGGNFTVLCDRGLFRIDRKDGDALGEAVPEAAAAAEIPENPPEESVLWDTLRTVYDPEIPVNLVDLGLVYNLSVAPMPDGQKGFRVHVDMTLTAPGCGMGPAIAEDARGRLMEVPGVVEADVEIVWDPPWNQDMISEAGKMELGLI